MIAAWYLAAFLLDPPPECPPTDNRCQAERFEQKAKKAPTPQVRARYLLGAHLALRNLYDQTRVTRDLCAARRMFEQSLAIPGQSESQRARLEAVRSELVSRESAAGHPCKSTRVRNTKAPPKMLAVEAGGPAPTTPAPTAPPNETAAPAHTAVSGTSAPAGDPGDAVVVAPPTPSSPVSTAEGAPMERPPVVAPNPRGVDGDGLLPVGRPRPQHDRAGRSLTVMGGVMLGAGVSFTATTGYFGRLLAENLQSAERLHATPYGTPEQITEDAALKREYGRLAPRTLAFALAGGTTLIAGAVMLGFGVKRIARATTRTAFAPVPGGLVFSTRF